jgi:hypothetical protein
MGLKIEDWRLHSTDKSSTPISQRNFSKREQEWIVVKYSVSFSSVDR